VEDFLRRGQVPVSALTLEAAREYVVSLLDQETLYEGHPVHQVREQKLSPFTIHQRVRVIHTFGAWLNKTGHPNRLAELQFPKLPRRLIEILTEEEIDRLFNLYNPDTHYGARWQAMLAFFLQSGVRLSEMLGLTRDRLELDKFRARIIGKGDKERYVPFGTKSHQTVSRYFNLFRPKCERPQVFLNLDGTPPTASTIEHMMSHVRAKTGIEKLHVHLFRHAFATNYLLAGGNVFDLQDILGHEDLGMTRRYVHLAQALSRTSTRPEQMQRRIALVDEMPGLKASRPESRGSRRHGATGRFTPGLTESSSTR
jgi:site-specific recombinase XerD